MLKVPLRVGTMRVAGAWFEGLLREDPGMRDGIFPDALKFYLGLSNRTGTKVEMDRGLAERLVSDWLEDFKKYDPTLLLRVSGAPVPDDGLRAMAELILFIKAALHRKRGRQHQINPLEAYEINEHAKRTRRRSAAGEAGKHAHEQVAEQLGVSNKETIAKAVKEGREIVDEWPDKAVLIPNGAEVMMHLVDHAAPPGQRIKGTIFSTGKHPPPFTGEDSD